MTLKETKITEAGRGTILLNFEALEWVSKCLLEAIRKLLTNRFGINLENIIVPFSSKKDKTERVVTWSLVACRATKMEFAYASHGGRRARVGKDLPILSEILKKKSSF